MAFTRGWDNAAPPGTRNAAEIDDAIREVRQDIDERLAAKIFTTAMPNNTTEANVVVRPEVLGNVTGKKLLVHGSAFMEESVAGLVWGDNGLQSASSVGPLRAALSLPPGAVITKTRWLITGGDAGNITHGVYSLSFTVGLAVATESDFVSAVAAAHIADSGVIAVTIADNKLYFLKCDKSGGAAYTLHGVEITYDVADCRITN